MKYLREGQKVGERESLRWFAEGQAWEKGNERLNDCRLVSMLVWTHTTPDQHNVSYIFKLQLFSQSEGALCVHIFCLQV